MKRLLLAAAFALPVFAHPGVGVVVDSKGNIFYTDLKQVMRLAPNGALGIAVPNVHTHELWIDSNDNVYGENLWFNGEAVNTWDHMMWRRTPAGVVETVVPRRRAFEDFDFALVRDAHGNSYWHDTKTHRIFKCSKTCTPATSMHFQDIRWMTATPGGTLYVIDLVDLVRITPDGRATVVARDLSAKRQKHEVMGVWTDARENVYVADWGGGEVKRVDAHGKVTVVDRSHFPWAPSGGAIAKNGDLIVLEYKRGPFDEARIRRVKMTR
jgi:hypothetical protein